MGAFERLPLEGRQACSALAGATRWSAEEWARSVRSLSAAGLYPAIGLADVARLSHASGLPPRDVADVLVLEAARAMQAERRREAAEEG